VKELGTKSLTKKETSKVWELVDAVDIAGRKKGHEDEDEGWVSLRLRESCAAEHAPAGAITRTCGSSPLSWSLAPWPPAPRVAAM
jgi:hypothetical protein